MKKNILLIIILSIKINVAIAQDISTGPVYNYNFINGQNNSSKNPPNNKAHTDKVPEEQKNTSIRYSDSLFFNIGLGITTFTGNRGDAYEENSPSYHLSLAYFLSPKTALTFGLEHSTHTMYIDTYVNAAPDTIIGAVETAMQRVFLGFRYYPGEVSSGKFFNNFYLAGRLESWHQSNSFIDSSILADESASVLGSSLGLGLDFPSNENKSFLNVEFLYHRVNFFDSHTQDYRKIEDPDHDHASYPSDYGFDDLQGDVLTFFISYSIGI